MVNDPPVSLFGSLYEQVAARIRGEILSGVLKEGDRLPAIRSLAADLGVSRLTVHKAYQLLADERVVVGQWGSGTYVAPLQMREISKSYLGRFTEIGPLIDFEQICRQSQIISFATLVPDMRLVDLRDFYADQVVMNDSDSWSQYAPNWAGEPRLRDAVIPWFEALKIPVERDQVLIRSGSGGLEMFLRAEVEPGETILFDDPGLLYGEAISASRGLDKVGFFAARQTAEELLALLESRKVSAVAINPHFGWGAGQGWNCDQLKVLADYSRENDVALYFSCSYGLLGFEQVPDLFGVFSETEYWAEIVFNSLTASAFQPIAVRVPESRKEIVEGPYLGNGGMPRVAQLAAAKFLKDSLPGHLEKVQLEYAKRGRQMYHGLRSGLHGDIEVIRPLGGMGLVIRLPQAVDAVELFHAAIAENVALMPGQFVCAEPDNFRLIRFAFGALSVDEIGVGAERAAAVINRAIQH